MPLQELIQQLITFLRGMWRYRWFAMALAWVVAIGGWMFVIQLPDEYQASARVHVDTESVLRPLLKGLAVQSNVTQRVSLMTKKLLSRPVLEKVARMTDLDIRANSPQEMEEIIRSLRKRIKINATKRSNLYTISAYYDDPNVAKEIVQSMVTIFVEDTLGDSRKGSTAAQAFLKQKIADYEDKLREAEQRIKEFQQSNMGKLPTPGRNYFDKLQRAKVELRTAKLRLREIKIKRDELRRQIAGEEPVFGLMKRDAIQEDSHPLDARISQMHTELSNLLLQYTEFHPKIISIEETIKILEEQRKNEIAARPKKSVMQSPILDKNPVYQQIKIELGRTEAELSSIQVRVAEYQKRVRELNDMANTVPEIEAKMKDLNRDYNLHKSNYNTLLARLESAKLSEQAEKSGDDISFEVIEPPRLPSEPSGPNRVMFSSAALVGGLVVGMLFAFLMSQLRPTFYDQRTLGHVTELPVFGSVSRIWTPELLVKKRIEFGGFLSVGFLLGVAFASILVVNTTAPEISAQIANTVRLIAP